MKDEQWIVGPEFESQLLSTLEVSLKALGYTLDAKSWGVGGSQELSVWAVQGPKGMLTIQAETYVGLSVSGEPMLVKELRHHFASIQPANNSLKSDAAEPRTLG